MKEYLPNSIPSFADVVYGVKRMQYIVNFLADDPANKNMMKFIKHVKENGPSMKDKTLYIDKNDVQDKLTEADIAAIYPYKFELVDQEKIDQAILDSNPDIIYIMLADTPGANGNSTIQGVNGASDGKIYCTEWSMVTVQVKQSDLLTYNQRIGKKNLKAFASCAN